MYTYKVPKIDRTTKRRSVTLPDQSLSITEIVKRFVRGIPVDVVQRQGVYIDQSDYDLEKMSRMDFADKAEFAAELKARNQAIAEAVDNERAKRESEAQSEAQAAKRAAGNGAGIDSLDNTMPDDTTQNSSELQANSRRGKKQ